MGGQVARGCDVGFITDGKQDLCCGFDADSGHTLFKTLEKGKPSSMSSTWPAIVSCWAFSAFNVGC